MQRKYTKVKTLIKLHLGKTPTVPVMAEKEREDKPLCLPTLRRDALASTRQEILAI